MIKSLPNNLFKKVIKFLILYILIYLLTLGLFFLLNNVHNVRYSTIFNFSKIMVMLSPLFFIVFIRKEQISIIYKLLLIMIIPIISFLIIMGLINGLVSIYLLSKQGEVLNNYQEPIPVIQLR